MVVLDQCSSRSFVKSKIKYIEFSWINLFSTNTAFLNSNNKTNRKEQNSKNIRLSYSLVFSFRVDSFCLQLYLSQKTKDQYNTSSVPMPPKICTVAKAAFWKAWFHLTWHGKLTAKICLYKHLAVNHYHGSLRFQPEGKARLSRYTSESPMAAWLIQTGEIEQTVSAWYASAVLDSYREPYCMTILPDRGRCALLTHGHTFTFSFSAKVEKYIFTWKNNIEKKPHLYLNVIDSANHYSPRSPYWGFLIRTAWFNITWQGQVTARLPMALIRPTCPTFIQNKLRKSGRYSLHSTFMHSIHRKE